VLALSIRRFNFHRVKELTQIFQATVTPHCGLSKLILLQKKPSDGAPIKVTVAV